MKLQCPVCGELFDKMNSFTEHMIEQEGFASDNIIPRLLDSGVLSAQEVEFFKDEPEPQRVWNWNPPPTDSKQRRYNY